MTLLTPLDAGEGWVALSTLGLVPQESWRWQGGRWSTERIWPCPSPGVQAETIPQRFLRKPDGRTWAASVRGETFHPLIYFFLVYFFNQLFSLYFIIMSEDSKELGAKESLPSNQWRGCLRKQNLFKHVRSRSFRERKELQSPPPQELWGKCILSTPPHSPAPSPEISPECISTFCSLMFC